MKKYVYLWLMGLFLFFVFLYFSNCLKISRHYFYGKSLLKIQLFSNRRIVGKEVVLRFFVCLFLEMLCEIQDFENLIVFLKSVLLRYNFIVKISDFKCIIP